MFNDIKRKKIKLIKLAYRLQTDAERLDKLLGMQRGTRKICLYGTCTMFKDQENAEQKYYLRYLGRVLFFPYYFARNYLSLWKDSLQISP